ncbi:uncharacterized protein LOC135163107 isoform X2 [Diachasmimorpha longicaudata]|uniref:uncharacterized protein LOC135163107 isoform X2 n=1 Tax=Diachasmimorpha longicaudata TaxID=58733 RepID=UPI0030B8A23F
MNKFASGIFITLRGYHGKGRGRRRENRFRKTNPAVTEQQLYPDVDEYDQPNEHDFDDVEKDEANFMAANRAYTEHMREKYHEKEKVKVQIIARKYFKPDDPNFITWTEKMQIKSLYAKDPVEWSPERLSESFPALPDTIRRILRANWQPKNAQTVVNYDTKVIENWNKFKSGNIAVSSKLEAHLQQFKGRKIEVADLETIAEKFVRPKPVFPEPKATLFKSIVQDFIQPLTTTKDIPKISDGNENRKLDFSKLNVRKSRMNFDTFVKTTVEKIDSTDNLSLEVQLLVGEYKKKKDEETLEISDIAGAEVEGITVNNRNERTPFEVKEDEKITMQGRNIFSEGELLGELFNKRNRKILEGRKEQKKDGKMMEQTKKKMSK